LIDRNNYFFIDLIIFYYNIKNSGQSRLVPALKGGKLNI
jgi:hypothetical protein